jgi:beta-galactosidase
MRIGVDYYPEQWSEKRWKTDLELMNKANIKVVRIGEFSWSLYEPQEGEFDFAWMDKILDTLRKYNISAVLCTPSATPPK